MNKVTSPRPKRPRQPDKAPAFANPQPGLTPGLFYAIAHQYCRNILRTSHLNPGHSIFWVKRVAFYDGDQCIRECGAGFALGGSAVKPLNVSPWTLSMRTLTIIIAGLAMAFGAATASAAPIGFDLNSPDSRTGISNSTYAKGYNYSEDDIGLNITGWSYGTKTTTTQTCTKYNKKGQCTKYATTTTTSVVEAIEQDFVGKWDGLGIEKTDSPNHAIDNENGDYDMLLLSFDQLVKLTSLDLGWIYLDSDISILAFDGDTFDSSSLLGKKWQDLLLENWFSVGNYYNVDYSANSGLVNTNGYTAKYWLIGAYNPNLGGSWDGDNLNYTGQTDYFKLKGVTVEKPPVIELPEPSAFLLVLLGLIGIGLRRSKR
ncbi:PEP-CTERM putative exosortase interaction domain protein [Cellvibrio japonicus Ueda107]|uniref:PEP-CTERM putative exosortase interaction domain protein n=2 Tax=Cellvibrio japonicus TaxID=155077 RepID=B3PDV0_CELJU|nr:PEP-CTERM putative exosortase interaction domain protein [Cellvibrio japonicus Ueda107]